MNYNARRKKSRYVLYNGKRAIYPGGGKTTIERVVCTEVWVGNELMQKKKDRKARYHMHGTEEGKGQEDNRRDDDRKNKHVEKWRSERVWGPYRTDTPQHPTSDFSNRLP